MEELATYVLLFIGALFVLIKASDFFVDAAEAIGLSLGATPFVIGVTIVSFGTSLPELATSIASVYSGSSEIVVGNVVGSNITNILLVLALIIIYARTVHLDFNVMDMDMPLLVCSAFFMWFTLMDGHLSLLDALLYLAGLVIFILHSFSEKVDDIIEHRHARWRDYLVLAITIAAIYAGAHFTIHAIENISVRIGVGNEIIALTAVALGTSLPEVVVSVNAARKGKIAIAVGNVLGSNVFNTLAVMSIPRFFGELIIPATILEFNMPLMVAVTLIFAVMCITPRISRWAGWMLLVFYIFFMYRAFV